MEIILVIETPVRFLYFSGTFQRNVHNYKEHTEEVK